MSFVDQTMFGTVLQDENEGHRLIPDSGIEVHDIKDEDLVLAAREWKEIESRARTGGYREGRDRGQEDSLQEGFDQGYREKFRRGRRLGRLRGRLAARRLRVEAGAGEAERAGVGERRAELLAPLDSLARMVEEVDVDTDVEPLERRLRDLAMVWPGSGH